MLKVKLKSGELKTCEKVEFYGKKVLLATDIKQPAPNYEFVDIDKMSWIGESK